MPLKAVRLFLRPSSSGRVMVVNAEDLTEDNRPPDWNVITITAEMSAEQIVVDVKGALKHV